MSDEDPSPLLAEFDQEGPLRERNEALPWSVVQTVLLIMGALIVGAGVASAAWFFATYSNPTQAQIPTTCVSTWGSSELLISKDDVRTRKRFAEPGMYLGCWRDSSISSFSSPYGLGKRDLSGLESDDPVLPRNTPSSCIAFCQVNGFLYAGLQAGKQCFCGNSYGRYGTDPDEYCETPCTGSTAQHCGGHWHNAVFQALSEPLPPLPSVGTYLGCWKDSAPQSPYGPGPRDMDGLKKETPTLKNNSPSACMNLCASQNFRYAGVQQGSLCFCGNSFGRYGPSSSGCNITCPNGGGYCGGIWRNSVYVASAPTNGFLSEVVSASSTVTSSGSFHYNIPLVFPAGTSVFPSLSLVYDSSQRNSILGLGWMLSGLSRIHRCPLTPFTDGRTASITWTVADALCWDGERIIFVGNKNAGQQSYRSMREDFARIIAYESSAQGPSRWEIQDNAGLIWQFGGTASSISAVVVNGKNVTAIWALSSVTDRFGNSYSVTYTAGGVGNLSPASILYTSNPSSTTPPCCSIIFSYEPRPDTESGWLSGQQVSVEKRLTAIRGYRENQLAAEYLLTYLPVKTEFPRSELASVQRCGMLSAPGTPRCTAPTNFTYGENPPSQILTRIPISYHYGHSPYIVGDFNGDGKSDILRRTDDHHTWHMMSYSAGKMKEYQYHRSGDPSLSLKNPSMTGDFNGDGRSDVIIMDKHSLWVFFATSKTSLSFSVKQWKTPSYDWKSTIGNSKPRPYVTYVADYNGDGRSDILHVVSRQGFYVWLSNCVDSVVSFTQSPLQTISNPSSGTHFWSSFNGDFDGDGLDDWLWVQDDGVLRYFITRLLPTGAYSSNALTVKNFSPVKADLDDKDQWNVADVNGDGNHDTVYFAKSQSKLTVVTVFSKGGSSIDGSQVRAFEPAKSASDPKVRAAYGSVDKRRFIILDLNQDGMSDLIHFKSYKEFYLWLSKGDGTWNIVSACNKNNIDLSTPSSEYRWLVGDFDGSGSFDVVHLSSSESGDLYLNNLHPTQALLTAVDDGLTEMGVEYSALTDPEVYRDGALSPKYPTSRINSGDMQVVRRTITANGLQADSSYVVSYRYEGALYHHLGLGFLGFAQRRRTDEQTGISTVSTYSQDYENNIFGLLDSEFDSSREGVTFHSSTVTRAFENVALGDGIPQHVSYYAYEGVRREFFFDFQTGTQISNSTATIVAARSSLGFTTMQSTTSMDSYGIYNLTTVRQFTNDISPRWLLGMLTSVVETRCTLDRLLPLQCTTRTTAEIHDPSTGALLSSIVEPNNPALRVQTTVSLDIFGNTNSSTVIAPGVPSTTGTFQYDSTGRFLLASTNTLGHTVRTQYHPVLDVVQTVTDANGLVTSFTYDPLGRATSVSHPNGLVEYTDRLWCGSVSCSPLAQTLVITHDNCGSWAATHFDPLQREVRTVKLLLGANYSYVDSQYDAQLRLNRKSLPYFSSDPTKIAWVSYQYDPLGRVLAVHVPAGGVTNMRYHGSSVFTRDPLGRVSVSSSNAEGKLVQVTDALNYLTKYAYTPYGDTTLIVNSAGINIRRYFDPYGRIVLLQDPNRGNVTYTYDALGRLLKTVFASGRWMMQSFDTIGRVLTITTSENRAIVNTYDICPNGIGLLCLRTDTIGYNFQVVYDSLSRESASLHWIDAELFVFNTTYDSVGRIAKFSQPGQVCSVMSYSPENFAYRRSLCSTNATLWQILVVDAFGRVTQKQLGANLIRNVSFDQLSRIVQVNSGSALSMQASYDFLGNVLSQTDLLHGSLQNYSYDSLNRLLSANWTSSSSLPSVVSYTYDQTGNILTKSDVGNYTYSPSRPQAVSTVVGAAGSTMAFTYDADGNLINDGSRLLSYDAFNKPVSINSSLSSSVMRYTPDLLRLTRVVSTVAGSTVTTSLPSFERIVTGQSVTYRYSMGEDVIVYVTVTNQVSAQEILVMHRDHLGSVVVVTDTLGVTKQLRSYEAFGSGRNTTSWAPMNGSALYPETFTGHYELVTEQLVDMQGRIYNPQLGRFVTPDSLIGQLDNPQTLNAYSYVLNNPTSLVDPSGHMAFGSAAARVWKGVSRITGTRLLHKLLKRSRLARQIGRIVVVAVATSVGGPAGAIGASAAYEAYMCKLDGGTEGQMLKAAAIAAAETAAFFEIGEAGASQIGQSVHNSSPTLYHSLKATAHGTIAGTSSVLRGGKFGSAFAAAAAGQAIEAYNTQQTVPSMISRVILAGATGGAASKLAGGKFSPGFVVAALGRLVNDELHRIEFHENLAREMQAQLQATWEDYWGYTGMAIDTVSALSGGRGAGLGRVTRAAGKFYDGADVLNDFWEKGFTPAGLLSAAYHVGTMVVSRFFIWYSHMEFMNNINTLGTGAQFHRVIAERMRAGSSEADAVRFAIAFVYGDD